MLGHVNLFLHLQVLWTQRYKLRTWARLKSNNIGEASSCALKPGEAQPGDYNAAKSAAYPLPNAWDTTKDERISTFFYEVGKRIKSHPNLIFQWQ